MSEPRIPGSPEHPNRSADTLYGPLYAPIEPVPWNVELGGLSRADGRRSMSLPNAHHKARCRMIPNTFVIYGVRKGSDLLHDRLRHRSSNLSFSQVLLDGGITEDQVRESTSCNMLCCVATCLNMVCRVLALTAAPPAVCGVGQVAVAADARARPQPTQSGQSIRGRRLAARAQEGGRGAQHLRPGD